MGSSIHSTMCSLCSIGTVRLLLRIYLVMIIPCHRVDPPNSSSPSRKGHLISSAVPHHLYRLHLPGRSILHRTISLIGRLIVSWPVKAVLLPRGRKDRFPTATSRYRSTSSRRSSSSRLPCRRSKRSHPLVSRQRGSFRLGSRSRHASALPRVQLLSLLCRLGS